MSAARRRRRANESADKPKGRAVRRPSLVSAPSTTSGSPPPMATPAFSGRALWTSLALILVNMVVYASVWHHDFVNWDDPIYVTGNTHVLGGLTWQGVWWAFTTGRDANWFPLTWLSHMLDVQVYGLNAGGHHLTNVLLHIANTILLFRLLHRITGMPGRSAFVAALFAVHPLHVESVAWVSERKDVLSTLFGMLTLWGYVGYVRRPGLGRYGLVLLVFATGLMAKPMLVTLPFVLLLLDVWPLGRVKLGGDPGGTGWESLWGQRSVALQLVREKIPLFALAVVSSIVTFVVQQQGGAVRGLDALPLRLRVENAVVSYIAYLAKMLWPARLAVFYPFPRSLPGWWVVGAIVALIGVSVVVIRKARHHPYLPVGWLWYLGTLVPVIGLVQVGGQALADRYTYIPLIGLFIIVAWGIPDLLAHWSHRRMALPAAAGLVILAGTITARGQIQYWGNSMSLWTHALEVTTENYRAHNNLGNVLADQGKLREAMAQYSEALRLNPAFAEAHNNLGNALARQGNTEEAISHYREALRTRPDYVLAHNGLGSALDDQGKVEEAIAHYTEALRLNPDFAEAHNNLGIALAKQGSLDPAIHEFLEVLRIKPNQADVHYNVAVLLDRKGENAEAIQHFEAVLKLNPRHAEAGRMLDDLTRRAKRSGLGTP